ncbi:unnamed protein product [Pleuronectes platessa]|uniref:Uncharacterized protein n=1 Tax=Pleuronectes platessa TaxID=8262 RepID=A0A9N7TSF0_PLEPL|nr:unnamed protein product [Pleuronectes platessa]
MAQERLSDLAVISIDQDIEECGAAPPLPSDSIPTLANSFHRTPHTESNVASISQNRPCAEATLKQCMLLRFDGHGQIGPPSPTWNALCVPLRGSSESFSCSSHFSIHVEMTDSPRIALGCDWSANASISEWKLPVPFPTSQ